MVFYGCKLLIFNTLPVLFFTQKALDNPHPMLYFVVTYPPEISGAGDSPIVDLYHPFPTVKDSKIWWMSAF